MAHFRIVSPQRSTLNAERETVINELKWLKKESDEFKAAVGAEKNGQSILDVEAFVNRLRAHFNLSHSIILKPRAVCVAWISKYSASFLMLCTKLTKTRFTLALDAPLKRPGRSPHLQSKGQLRVSERSCRVWVRRDANTRPDARRGSSCPSSLFAETIPGTYGLVQDQTIWAV